MKFLILSFCLIYCITCYTQTVINGHVRDTKGIGIIGANVFIEGSYDGTVTNETGDFQFTTAETGIRTIIVSFLSYETYKKTAEI